MMFNLFQQGCQWDESTEFWCVIDPTAERLCLKAACRRIREYVIRCAWKGNELVHPRMSAECMGTQSFLQPSPMPLMRSTRNGWPGLAATLIRIDSTRRQLPKTCSEVCPTGDNWNVNENHWLAHDKDDSQRAIVTISLDESRLGEILVRRARGSAQRDVGISVSAPRDDDNNGATRFSGRVEVFFGGVGGSSH